MKNLWIISILALGLYACISSTTEQETTKQTKTTAQYDIPELYNQYIIVSQTEVINSILELSAAVDGGDPEAIKTTYNDYVKTVEEVNTNICKLECFKGDCQLRDAAMSLFNFYEEIAKNEYREIIDILQIDEDELTAEHINRMNELITSVNDKETKQDADFKKAQNNFANRYGLTLDYNEMQKKIDNM
ncbi:MAG: hypothetical protein PHZ24_12445 [Bacteroidales bacterium]|nr:hypothetical protein [Bacteroidales bacterium]